MQRLQSRHGQGAGGSKRQCHPQAGAAFQHQRDSVADSVLHGHRIQGEGRQ